MIKKDIILNSLSSVVSAGVLFFTTPIYIQYMGVDVFGLIAFLGVLQASFGILDLGLGQALSREMVFFMAGKKTNNSTRNLIRSIEWILIIVCVISTIIIFSSSELIANYWLKPNENLSRLNIDTCIKIMSIIVPLRIIESVYKGAIIGLHRQARFNIINLNIIVFRAVTNVSIIFLFSDSIVIFFVIQLIFSFIFSGLLIVNFYLLLPPSNGKTFFSWIEIKKIKSFSIGIIQSSILSICTSQTDKIMLSKLLPLEAFGSYSLAGSLGAVTQLLVGPIAQAYQPRITTAIAENNTEKLKDIFHTSTQLIVVSMGCISILFITNIEKILYLWLGSESVASSLSPIAKIVIAGALINGLTLIPFILQLAYGNTRIIVLQGIVSSLIIVPALYLIVPTYGAIGAASVWTCLNLGNFLIFTPMIIRQYMKNEIKDWYLRDNFLPLFVATISIYSLKEIMPVFSSNLPYFIYLFISGILSLGLSSISANKIFIYFIGIKNRFN